MEKNFQAYIKRLEKQIYSYIPPRGQWTPVDEALYKPLDLYRIPLKEAEQMQLKALRLN